MCDGPLLLEKVPVHTASNWTGTDRRAHSEPCCSPQCVLLEDGVDNFTLVSGKGLACLALVATTALTDRTSPKRRFRQFVTEARCQRRPNEWCRDPGYEMPNLSKTSRSAVAQTRASAQAIHIEPHIGERSHQRCIWTGTVPAHSARDGPTPSAQ